MAAGDGDGDPENGRSSRDDFARVVAKTAVCQICESVGFQSFQASAVETLADLAIRYLRDLSKTTHYYANLAGRTQSNAFDVILALDQLSNSNALREVMRYVEYSEEIPFCKPLPRFPVAKKRSAAPSFAQLGETPPGSHIPSWLPALPDPHTYRSTPVWADKKRDAAADRSEQAKQKRKGENCFISLNLRLSSNKSGVSGSNGGLVPFGVLSKEQEDVIARLGGSMNNGDAIAGNPYLAPPLETAQQVSPVLLEEREREKVKGEAAAEEEEGREEEEEDAHRHPSVIGAFAAVLESASADAEKDSLLQVEDDEHHQQQQQQQQQQMMMMKKMKMLPDVSERSRVFLRFDFGSKVHAKGVCAHLSLQQHQNRQQQKNQHQKNQQQLQQQQQQQQQQSSNAMVVMMMRDEDDKKKRAEQILSHMEE